MLVRGLAGGSPHSVPTRRYSDLVVRRDLPMTHAMFSGMGDLQSVTFRGRGARGDDVYDLDLANGGVTLTAALVADGRMDGGIHRPAGPPAPTAAPTSAPAAGTDA